jgi:hypothetical protein
MKKRSPSSGQNSQLLHWWLLVRSGHPGFNLTGSSIVKGMLVSIAFHLYKN